MRKRYQYAIAVVVAAVVTFGVLSVGHCETLEGERDVSGVWNRTNETTDQVLLSLLWGQVAASSRPQGREEPMLEGRHESNGKEASVSFDAPGKGPGTSLGSGGHPARRHEAGTLREVPTTAIPSAPRGLFKAAGGSLVVSALPSCNAPRTQARLVWPLSLYTLSIGSDLAATAWAESRGAVEANPIHRNKTARYAIGAATVAGLTAVDVHLQKKGKKGTARALRVVVFAARAFATVHNLKQASGK